MPPSWSDIWNLPLLWNTAGRWALAIGAFSVTFVVLPIVKAFIDSKRRQWIKSRLDVPDAMDLFARLVHRTRRLFLWTVAIYLGTLFVSLPARAERILDVAIVLVFWIQMGLWAMEALQFAVDRRTSRAGVTDQRHSASLQILTFAANLVVWTMVFLLALDNLNIQIKPLLAGLGIGGIAVALAVQTVLGDLLASMSIALDKPFTIGDALAIDAFQGTVEHIGVKSTRLRSVSGEQIIMSNADILKSRVRNYGRMLERRISMTIGVTYDTPAETLRAIPAFMREIVEAQSRARFDRCHFLNYSESALQFELVFFVTDPDYNLYADIQQAINLAILERFHALGVKFAVPTTRMITS